MLDPDYALVGIAPSPNRPYARRNEPFGARSHDMLQRILDQYSLSDRVYITNLIKIPTPSGAKISHSTLRFAYPLLLEELKMVKPKKRVLALGNYPASVLCPGFKNMREDHGTIFFNPDLSLYVVPTYHFSAIGRDPSLLRFLVRDFDRLLSLPSPTAPAYTILDAGLRGLEEWIVDEEEVFLDIETAGLSLFDRILMVGLTTSQLDEVLIIKDPTQAQLQRLMAILAKHDIKLIGHNMQFDMSRIMYHGNLSWLSPITDTMLLAHTAGESILSLKHLVTYYTNRPGSHAFGTFSDPAYLAEDVLGTKEVYPKMAPKMPAPVHTLLSNVLPIFAAMEKRGVYVDRQMLLGMQADYIEATNKSFAKLTEEAGHIINWNSPQQVVKLLVERGVELSDKTKTGAYSVSEPVLLSLPQTPLVEALLQYRGQKKDQAFIESYIALTTDEHPYLHPTLKLHGTDTGRLSCVDPNLQQVPRVGPIKEAFRSRFPGGKILLCDLSQAELRAVAYLSNDLALAKALMKEDVHRFIASRIFKKPEEEVTSGERKKSKGVTFGLLYGGSPEGLADRVGVSTAEVVNILQDFFGLFPDLGKWLVRTGKKGVSEKQIYTLTGRRRDLTSLILAEGEGGARRKAINTPVQSLASDLMLYIVHYFTEGLLIGPRRLHSRPIFTVHDSLVIELYPGELEAVSFLLDNAFAKLELTPLSRLPLWGKLPIIGELAVGNSWAECESTNGGYNPEYTAELTSTKELIPI